MLARNPCFDSSGEGVWVPGDLLQPLDWNRFLRNDACSPSQPPDVEVVLKDPQARSQQSGFIRCAAAVALAQVRKDLIDLGAKDDGLPHVETAQTPPQQARPPGPSSPVSSNGIAKIAPVEATIGPDGLQLLALPKPGSPVAFKAPAGAAVIIDAKTPEGWLHIVAKQSKEHWKPTPPFYGWAKPGSFPER